METSAFDLLLVPILWGTFWGIVVGSALQLLMRALECVLEHAGRALRSWKEHSTIAREPRPRLRRLPIRRPVRLHG
jgi:hypothetical protein